MPRPSDPHDPRHGVGWFEPDEEVPAFSKKIASILDASWPETKRYTADEVTQQAGDLELDLRPKEEELFKGTWERDLLAALDTLDAAQVTPEQRKRLSRDPGAAEIRAQLARGPEPEGEATGPSVKLRRGDVDGALAAYKQAIDRNPDHPQPWTKRGIAYARLGRLERAVADYSRALELEAEYLPALANRGSARFHLGDLAGTVADCTAAVELEPKLAMAWLFRGIARAKLDERESANEDLYHFLKLTPYSPYVELIRATLKERCNWDEDSDEGEVLEEG
ncbi:MAG: tetratricopeptide repeat protein [Planctomycetota bacterium]